ncbi:sensor histidine kinase [Curtobacterium flaccumfaciens]|uniref:sensor histidine kinase n=1 Tax=Curtobacterium flaccumfaciens TaxID=2035 RepID=UPI001BDE7183|nr:histidine kinase [Curtobacterium flaccumfaciens]MBT1606046.1 sensor histidine kinase [Curtobacterium flaccumfaciens pv. betae]MBT1656116.1 sensor histidine kinase [Curtobacterium flaccumfaciens pv. betae]MCS0470018.1 histidine kinase [Curtobacterium flaccumfaciens pv. betae]MCS0473184.1 histidine kinase [Curtobacterium flaccumfaciens pv. betae]MCS0476866.1 histidine kinase [Curtobacterium flaccumfaciens pv. betae]
MFRPMLRAQVITDLLIAVLLGGLVLVASGRGLDGPLSVVTVVGMTGALAIRRLSPGLALAVAWVFAVFEMVTLQVPDVSNAFIAGVMYTTSAYGSRRVRLAGLVSAILGSVAAAAYMGFDDYRNRLTYETTSTSLPESLQVTLSFFAVVLLLLLLPWLAGLVIRTRRSASMSREAQLLAERDAARADRAVAVEQERVRIARDMHDIVAHSLAVVIAQSDGARYALKADPAVADQALSTISATARRALGDVRELLGALRHEQGTAPTPEIDDIDRLVDEMRQLGLDVRVEREGDPAGLPTTTQLAVYRIVQESLTNAYKHGEPGSPVRAALTYRPDTVEIAVVNRRADDGVRGPGTGHGLVGMRERAVMTGGTMTAGARGDDFAVAVRMPTVPASGQMPRGRITPTEQERTAR